MMIFKNNFSSFTLKTNENFEHGFSFRKVTNIMVLIANVLFYDVS